MREGFFTDSAWQKAAPTESLIPQCGACKLYKGCNSPKMEPSGKGKRRILIVAEAPGADEDDQGIQLIGRAGQFLEEAIDDIGGNMRRDCILTNAIICRPPNNATPTNAQIRYCRPNLTKTIEQYEPEIIIPLGATAIKSLLGGIWKEKVGGIARWVGFQIPCQKPNVWICPNWHPSYLVREGGNDVLELWFKRYLAAAFSLNRRPWDMVPDYRSKVNIITRVSDAADNITMTPKDVPVAFDYETNMLKPDSDQAQIVSCSMSIGSETMAFPWTGDVIKAMRSFLRGNNPKIASNMKFEDRWTRRFFGRGARNWWWDTMLAAHVLDNREGITGLKFQSFVRLGAPSYDDYIKPFLKSKTSYTPNRIWEADLNELLLYNGLDSLLEWKVAMSQRKEFGYERS